MIGAIAGAVGGLGLLGYGAYEPNCPLYGPVTGWGPRDQRVYLTFDDGPNPGPTEAVLDVLRREAVPAAFFMVGRHVESFPDTARAVRDAGHLIGNHTYTHAKLHRRGPGRIQAELTAAHEVIGRVLGTAPTAFRAPHGYRNPFVAPTIRRLGYRVFGWTYGVWDTDRPGAEVIRRRMARKLRGGAILLLHDGDGNQPGGDRWQTAEALPGIIADVRAAGLEFHSLGELCR